MTAREKVLARIRREIVGIVTRHAEAAVASRSLGGSYNGEADEARESAPWRALRRIIEAHECRPFQSFDDYTDCMDDVRCPVALAAQEIGE